MKQDNNLINTIKTQYRLQKVFVGDDEIYPEKCPECEIKGYEKYLRFLYINFKEAVYKCPSANCLYPNKRFIYKNYNNNTKYRYIRIKDCNFDINEFNINFLDDDYSVSHVEKPSTTETTINEFKENTIIASHTKSTIKPCPSVEQTETNATTTLTSSIEKPIITSLDFLSVAEEESISFSLNSITNPLMQTDATIDNNSKINNNNNYNTIDNHQCFENNLKDENGEKITIYENNNIIYDLNNDKNGIEYINILNDEPVNNDNNNNNNNNQLQDIYVNELDELLDSFKYENCTKDNTFEELLNDIFDDSNNFKKDEINVDTSLLINPYGVTNEIINNGKIITSNQYNIPPKRLVKCMDIIMNQNLDKFKKIKLGRKREKRKKISVSRTLTLLNAIHVTKSEVVTK